MSSSPAARAGRRVVKRLDEAECLALPEYAVQRGSIVSRVGQHDGGQRGRQVEALGGSIEISGPPGEGTTIGRVRTDVDPALPAPAVGGLAQYHPVAVIFCCWRTPLIPAGR
jgi:hypothetical protein